MKVRRDMLATCAQASNVRLSRMVKILVPVTALSNNSLLGARR
jgi:hypothetical protein